MGQPSAERHLLWDSLCRTVARPSSGRRARLLDAPKLSRSNSDRVVLQPKNELRGAAVAVSVPTAETTHAMVQRIPH